MAEGTNNPLANVLRFGFTPQGNTIPAPPGPGTMFVVNTSLVSIAIFRGPFGAGSSVTGTTGFRHEPYIIYGVGNPHQVLRFGRQPQGAQGSGGAPAGTSFPHEPYILYGLGNPHQIIRFGRQPVSLVPTGTTGFPHDPYIIYGLGNPHQVLRFGRLPVGQAPAPVTTTEHHDMPFIATPGQLKSW